MNIKKGLKNLILITATTALLANPLKSFSLDSITNFFAKPQIKKNIINYIPSNSNIDNNYKTKLEKIIQKFPIYKKSLYNVEKKEIEDILNSNKIEKIIHFEEYNKKINTLIKDSYNMLPKNTISFKKYKELNSIDSLNKIKEKHEYYKKIGLLKKTSSDTYNIININENINIFQKLESIEWKNIFSGYGLVGYTLFRPANALHRKNPYTCKNNQIGFKIQNNDAYVIAKKINTGLKILSYSYSKTKPKKTIIYHLNIENYTTKISKAFKENIETYLQKPICLELQKELKKQKLLKELKRWKKDFPNIATKFIEATMNSKLNSNIKGKGLAMLLQPLIQAKFTTKNGKYDSKIGKTPYDLVWGTKSKRDKYILNNIEFNNKPLTINQKTYNYLQRPFGYLVLFKKQIKLPKSYEFKSPIQDNFINEYNYTEKQILFPTENLLNAFNIYKSTHKPNFKYNLSENEDSKLKKGINEAIYEIGFKKIKNTFNLANK